MQTLSADMPLSLLRREILYTCARLRAHPRTPQLAEGFGRLRVELDRIEARANALVEQLTLAEANVDIVDFNLDGFVNVFNHTLLTVCANNRGHPLYVHFFGRQSPSRLKRPVLGKQLETMRVWPKALATAQPESVRALEGELKVLIAAADAAAAELDAAEQEERGFREIGERRQFLDALNALRKETYGKLGAIAHAHPEANLPGDFAEHFFLRETRRPITSESAERAIARLEKELTRYRTILAELREEEARDQRSRQEAERQQAAAEIAEVERKIAEEQARLAELRAKAEQAAAPAPVLADRDAD